MEVDDVAAVTDDVRAVRGTGRAAGTGREEAARAGDPSCTTARARGMAAAVGGLTGNASAGVDAAAASDRG